MKILLFGATGQLGRKFLDEALKNDHLVTAICRFPEKLNETKNPNLIVIKGDARNLDEIDEYFQDQDVVVSCLGEYRNPFSTLDLYSTFTRQVIDKIKKYEIKKIVVCSASGTVVSERRRASYFVQWIVFPLISSVLCDMQVMEELLKNSDVRYVVIRPTHLVDCKIFFKFSTLYGKLFSRRRFGSREWAFKNASFRFGRILREMFVEY
uniref:Flavin reductase (NADPH) (Trinotate prediction) n=1 Tax=Myxobolus squamalis TaxID=59785 RepID=A0A6B2G5D3_MYXSQ